MCPHFEESSQNLARRGLTEFELARVEAAVGLDHLFQGLALLDLRDAHDQALERRTGKLGEERVVGVAGLAGTDVPHVLHPLRRHHRHVPRHRHLRV